MQNIYKFLCLMFVGLNKIILKMSVYYLLMINLHAEIKEVGTNAHCLMIHSIGKKGKFIWHHCPHVSLQYETRVHVHPR